MLFVAPLVVQLANCRLPPAGRVGQASGPFIMTATSGPNPADKIFAIPSGRRRADDLLNSPQRPVYWKRTFETTRILAH